jgi:hypothetical protein
VFSRILQSFIRSYQLLLSPMLGHHCRFTPRCSDYALESFRRFNIAKASWLTLLRLLRCHPWHEGGNDPVPEMISPAPTKHTKACTTEVFNGQSAINDGNATKTKP